jgi:hypothetical protein
MFQTSSFEGEKVLYIISCKEGDLRLLSSLNSKADLLSSQSQCHYSVKVGRNTRLLFCSKSLQQMQNVNRNMMKRSTARHGIRNVFELKI